MVPPSIWSRKVSSSTVLSSSRPGDGASGFELWKSDGTEAGTVLVKDIQPRVGSSAPESFFSFGGTLFFSADDGEHGQELWKSDGTEAGTVLVKDLAPGPAGSSPTGIVNADGTVFFMADGSLWRSDGTEGGTVLVDGPFLFSTSLQSIGATVFWAQHQGGFVSLMKSDGPAQGTEVVADFLSISEITEFDGFLFLSADDGTGSELWKSDGTEKVLVRDINPAGGSSPRFFFDFDGTLMFSADDGTFGTELWASDGTETGTAMVRDIQPGAHSSVPHGFASMGGVLFFVADNGSTGPELWRSDGANAGTFIVDDIFSGSQGSSPANLVGG